jgi:hypothetical protein
MKFLERVENGTDALIDLRHTDQVPRAAKVVTVTEREVCAATRE